MSEATTTSIVRAGWNCWVKAEASRGAFLIDGAEYFRDVYDVLRHAERSVFILGWDISSRVPLVHDGGEAGWPPVLRDYLEVLARGKPGLSIYVLIWDFALYMSLEREPFTAARLSSLALPNFHFAWDAEHPVGACHHQKVVVIDDTVAYCGGLDLTMDRWDTPEHRARRPGCRKSKEGKTTTPFHDVMVKIGGEAARRLGLLCRERWRRGTGRDAAPAAEAPRADEERFWRRTDFRGTSVAISRSEPDYRGRPPVSEIRRLLADLIRSASRLLYIENQYFTEELVIDEIEKSLLRPSGPEIVLVLPGWPTGWLEEQTLWRIRDANLRRLMALDRGGRFRAYCAVSSDDPSIFIKVHSKVLIADDLYAFVSSANINRRSMGVDTECGVLVDGTADPGVRRAVARLLARLTGEHLGLTEGLAARALERGGSLIRLIEARGGKGRLRPLDAREERRPAYVPLVDLRRTLIVEKTADHLAFRTEARRGGFFKSKLFIAGSLAGLLLLLSSVWVLTPLRDVVDVELLRETFARLQSSRFSYVWVLGVYLIAAPIFLPLNLLILATAGLYGALEALCLVFAGTFLNASLGYAIGAVAGHRLLPRLFEERARHLSRRLSRKGFIPIFLVRLLPIAPFSAINMVCGAAGIRFRDYVIGTLLGIAPGAAALTLFQRSLLAVLRDASPRTLLLFLGVLGLLTWGAVYFRRRFGER